MRKRILLSLILLFLGVFSLSACGKGNSLTASFSQTEYTVSVGEELSFSGEITSDLEQNNFTISLSEPIATVSGLSVTGTSSGGAVVTLFYNGTAVTSTNLVVKGCFEVIDDVTLSDDGVLSWSESYAIVAGKIYTAESYTVVINNEPYTVFTNSYTLPSQGQYEVCVYANATTYVDEVDEQLKKSKSFYYGIMQEASDFLVTAKSDGIMNLSWSQEAGASYDVFVEGVQVASSLLTASIDVDFSNFAENKTVSVRIVSNDTTDAGNLSNEVTYSVTKLASLVASYEVFDGQGYITWAANAYASGYEVCYWAQNGEAVYAKDEDIVVSDGKVYYQLDGAPEGSYSVSVRALGGNCSGGYYASNNATVLTGISKLGFSSGDFEYSVSGDTLTIKITKSDITSYTLNLGSQTQLLTSEDFTEEGDKIVAQIDISSLESGALTLGLKANPYDGEQKQVSSDYVDFVIYVLADAENLTFTLNGTSGVLTFDTIENATSFSLTICDASAEITFEIGSQTTSITIANFAFYTPEDGAYTMQITALRSDNLSTYGTGTKTVYVLDTVSASSSQENGYFAWNAVEVESDVKYYYEIYSADSSYSITDSTPVATNTTTALQTESALSAGYYVIKIWTKSTNYDTYLDSDFGEGYFLGNILVTQQIETPTIAFSYDSSNYYLTIYTVSMGEKYSVYINGSYEGAIYNPQGASTVYTFSSTFFEAGTYEVTVVASTDTSDSNVYLQSESALVTVVRLEEPEFEVSESEVSESEVLSSQLVSGASSLVVQLGGDDLTLSENYEADISSIKGQTTITFQYKGVGSDEDTYYLDSNVLSVIFKRTSVPTDISFSSGTLTYACEDHTGAQPTYIITVTFYTQNSGSTSTTFTSTKLSFDLQSAIDALCLEDEKIADYYEQATEILVNVSAYRLGYPDDSKATFYLPSAQGTSVSGSTGLSLTALDETTLTFDTSALRLSWTEVGTTGTTYSIYIDDEVYSEGLTGLYAYLSNVDFSTARSITIVAKNSAYLSSASSEPIIIKQIAAASSINVLPENDTLSANISSADLEYVTKVMINDSEVTFGDTGAYSVSISDYAAANYVLKIQYIACDQKTISGVVNYYINSTAITYTLVDISTESSTIKLGDESISWTAVGTKMDGVSTSPLTYTLKIYDSTDALTTTIYDITDTSYALSESQLTVLTAGSYTIYVYATLSQSYKLSSDYSFSDYEAVGYFNTLEMGYVEVKKLSTPSGVTYANVDSSSTTDSAFQKINATLQIVWEDLWEGSTAEFDITISDTYLGPTVELTAVAAGDNKIVSNQGYSLTLAGGYYTLTLAGTYYSDISAGESVIAITVSASKAITSNTSETSLFVLEYISDFEIQSDGEISFTTPTGADTFTYSLSIGGSTANFTVTSAELNIVDYITDNMSDAVGSYTLYMIASDSTGEYVYNKVPVYKTGYRLQGLDTCTLSDDGAITMTLLNQKEDDGSLVFVAYINGEGKTFEPTNDGDEYTYSIAELVALFGIETDQDSLTAQIGVARADSISSPFKTISFAFQNETTTSITKKREISILTDGTYTEDASKDYLLVTQDLDSITGLYITISYTTTDSEEGTVSASIDAADYLGYWIVLENGKEYFSSVLPSLSSNFTYTQCYAFPISEYLEGYDAGEYNIVISRIAKISGVVTQFNSVTVTYTKLQAIDSSLLKVSGEYLTWTAVSDKNMSAYYVKVFTRSGTGTDSDPIVYTLYSQKEVFTTSVDLTDLISEAGTDFYVRVYVVSSKVSTEVDNDYLYIVSEGSKFNESTLYLTINRCQTTSQVTVSGGVITFNDDWVATSQLISDIETYSTSYEYLASLIATSTYTAPFYFTAATIGDQVVRLRLEDTTTGKIYYMSVPAVNLISSVLSTSTFTDKSGETRSYLRALELAIYNTDTTLIYRANLVTLYNALNNASAGIGNDEVLFDDYGAEIPGGTYNISVRQNGQSLNDYGYAVLPSAYTTNTQYYVALSPTISLSESNDTYYMSFKPVEIQSSAQEEATTAVTYMMVIRGYSETLSYKIVKVADADWRFYYDSSDNSSSESPYFSLSTTYKNGYITIDLTNDFKYYVTDVRSTCTVMIYAVGNSYSISSKNDNKSLTILDFDYASLSLEAGEITWSTTAANAYGTLVTYKHSALKTEQQMTIYDEGSCSLSLTTSGLYNYIAFKSLGGVSESAVIVDSDTYVIQTVYKRSAPVVTSENSMLQMSVSTAENMGYTGFVQFRITNDVADGLSILTSAIEAESDTYQPGKSVVNYSGSSDAEVLYRDTEESATEYSVSLVGTTATKDNSGYAFVLDDDNNNTSFDHLLVLNESSGIDYVVLSSDYTSISAQMLPSVSKYDISIYNGDFVWKEVDYELDEGYILAYKVSIYYYIGGSTTPSQTDTFYTTKTTLPTEYVDTIDDAQTIGMSVQVVAFAESQTLSSGTEVELVDGTIVYVATATAKTEADEDGESSTYYVLAGKEIEVSTTSITKCDTVYDVTLNSDGTISWVIDGSYNSSIMYYILDSEGNQIEVSVDDFVSEELSVDGLTSTLVTYTPNSQAFVYGTAYNIFIYSYVYGTQSANSDTSKIKSDAAALNKTFYKLDEVETEEAVLTYDSSTGYYTLDLSLYFENNTISGYNTIFYIELDYISGSLTLTASSSSVQILTTERDYAYLSKGVLYIPNSGITLTLSVKKMSTSSSWNLIPSDTTTYEIGSSNFSTLDSASWDEENYQVVWTRLQYVATQDIRYYTFNDQTLSLAGTILADDVVEIVGASEEYSGYYEVEIDGESYYISTTAFGTLDIVDVSEEQEFLVILTYLNGQTEIATVSGLDYYQPITAGTITSISVYVRFSATSIYSAEALTLEGPFYVDLFESGSGTADDPYIITTVEHLLNLTTRNTSQSNYHFLQKADITISLEDAFLISGYFYGCYDGGGYTLTVNLTGSATLTSSYSMNLLDGASSTTSYTYTKGIALFEYISSSASVENLNISLNISASDVSEGTMFAGVAIRNYGTISNVVIEESSVTIALASSANISIAGIAITNYGTITECENYSSLSLSIGNSSKGYYPCLAYAGIAIMTTASEGDGMIEKCFNYGNITLTASAGGTKFYLSGIVINVMSGGQVRYCGNEGAMTIKSVSTAGSDYSSYFAGIVVYVGSGSLRYCYNSGTLTTSQSSKYYMGGIAVSIRGSNTVIAALVETTGLAIASSVQSSVSTEVTCYANTTIDYVASTTLTNTTLSFTGGTLTITSSTTASGTTYTAKLSFS